MGELNETTTIDASAQLVWDLVSVQANWAIWTPAREVVLDPPGSPEPDGVGAVRRMRVAGPVSIGEEIFAYDPPSHMAYRLTSSFPVRNYQAHLHLEGDEGSTELRWTATWEDRIGLMRKPLLRTMTRTVQKMAAGIKEEAERLAADGA